MTLYTGSGDGGNTGLFSGERISKANARIQASGAVDELNSFLGALIAEIPNTQTDLITALQIIQSDLFLVGAWISTTPDSPAASQLQPFDTNRVANLEKGIDDMLGVLPKLDRFILPGGHLASAWAHIARSVCRRCECHAVQLYQHAQTGKQPENAQIILQFLNRLSDYLFVIARYCNQLNNQADIAWRG